jgi:hypothetical protein
MINWNLIFRRTHLFLGMLLIPWVFFYAVSTVLFNHHGYFQKYRLQEPQWLPLWEKDYTRDVPKSGEDALRETGRQIIADNGLSGAFFVQRQGGKLNVHVQNFWHPIRLTYQIDSKRLTAEKKRFAWVELAARLHYRVGYGQGGFLDNLWAFMVDAFSVTLLIWICTGVYLWWKLTQTRMWGFIAIGAGVGSILLLLLTV